MKQGKFLKDILFSYFPKEYNDIYMINGDDYLIYNVINHLEDFSWIKRYLLNKIFTDFDSKTDIVYELYDYIDSEDFQKDLQNYTNKYLCLIFKNVCNEIKQINKSYVKTIDKFSFFIQKKSNLKLETVNNFILENNNKLQHIYNSVNKNLEK